MKQAATALKLKEADPEFARQAKYFSQLGEKMSLIERIANRLHTDREGKLSTCTCTCTGVPEELTKSCGHFYWILPNIADINKLYNDVM